MSPLRSENRPSSPAGSEEQNGRKSCVSEELKGKLTRRRYMSEGGEDQHCFISPGCHEDRREDFEEEPPDEECVAPPEQELARCDVIDATALEKAPEEAPEEDDVSEAFENEFGCRTKPVELDSSVMEEQSRLIGRPRSPSKTEYFNLSATDDLDAGAVPCIVSLPCVSSPKCLPGRGKSSVFFTLVVRVVFVCGLVALGVFIGANNTLRQHVDHIVNGTPASNGIERSASNSSSPVSAEKATSARFPEKPMTSSGTQMVCADTASWVNPYGYSCSDYYRKGWCADGAAVPSMEWTLGSGFGNPAEHCCVCGKKGTAQVVRGNPECWFHGYSFDMCCHSRFGQRGNPQCWDSQFTYQRCCFTKSEL